MTTPLILILALGALWALLALLSRRDDAHLRRELRRLDTEGELLPALRDEPDWPVIRVNLPREEPPAFVVEHRQPTRQPSLESDVFVPALQTLFTALAAAIVAGLLALAFRWPIQVVLIATALVLALGWVWRLRLADSLLWRVESMTGKDIDKDGAIGAPRPVTLLNPSLARGEVKQLAQDAASTSKRADLLAFVGKCYQFGTSESAHGLKGGGGPDRERYREHRDVLLRLGVAAWKSPGRPSAGWRLVVSQEEAARIVAEHVI